MLELKQAALDPKPWADLPPLSPRRAATTSKKPPLTVDPRMHMHHQPGPCTHTSFTWKGRMPCLALGTSAHPGWLPGPQAPELVPWARGAAESGAPLGKHCCEREASPPTPTGAGSAESRWGRGAASSRQTAGMWGAQGTQGPTTEAERELAP